MEFIEGDTSIRKKCDDNVGNSVIVLNIYAWNIPLFNILINNLLTLSSIDSDEDNNFFAKKSMTVIYTIKVLNFTATTTVLYQKYEQIFSGYRLLFHDLIFKYSLKNQSLMYAAYSMHNFTFS